MACHGLGAAETIFLFAPLQGLFEHAAIFKVFQLGHSSEACREKNARAYTRRVKIEAL